jgi:predicted phage replisome organizer
MADKKFYWIKLKTDFFDLPTIDWLMSQKNGCEYIVLYQMLCLLTANNKGVLASRIGEMLIPFDAEKIARETKHFDVDTVIVALELFKKLGLVYEQEEQVLKIAAIEDMVGSSSMDEHTKKLNAERQRRFREKQKMLENNVTVTLFSNGDIEKEKEIRVKNITADEYKSTSIGGKEPSPSAPNLFDSFENEFGRPLTQIEIQEIAEFKEELPEEVVHEALKEAVLNQKMSFSYIRAILTSWKKKGIDTAEKAKKQVRSFKGNVSTANAAERTLPDWYSNPSQDETEGQEEVDMDEFQMYLNKIKKAKKG